MNKAIAYRDKFKPEHYKSNTRCVDSKKPSITFACHPLSNYLHILYSKANSSCLHGETFNMTYKQ